MSNQNTTSDMDLVDVAEWAIHNPVQAARHLRDAKHLAEFCAEMLMQAEVHWLCGPRRARTSEYQRWGTNPGTVCYKGERIRVRVPRVRHTEAGKERPLRSYKYLHRKHGKDAKVLHDKLIRGISQRDYKAVAQAHAHSIGLSRSTVGRTFIAHSTAAYKEFETRRLDKEKFAVLFIDGKCLQKRQVLIALGLTVTGKKVVLGIVESANESAAAVQSLLDDLIARGFGFDKRLLVIIDGAKGLRKAVNETFGDQALVHRCQVHKRRNVTHHIKNKDEAKKMKTRLQNAWEQNSYAEARRALRTIYDELSLSNPRAAASLSEGLEDTLTLHKLGIRKALRDSLKTTNIIESLNSVLAHRSRNVKRWRSSHQRHRWCGTIFMHFEETLKPIDESLMEELVTALKGETKSLVPPSTGAIRHPS